MGPGQFSQNNQKVQSLTAYTFSGHFLRCPVEVRICFQELEPSSKAPLQNESQEITSV